MVKAEHQNKTFDVIRSAKRKVNAVHNVTLIPLPHYAIFVYHLTISIFYALVHARTATITNRCYLLAKNINYSININGGGTSTLTLRNDNC